VKGISAESTASARAAAVARRRRRTSAAVAVQRTRAGATVGVVRHAASLQPHLRALLVVGREGTRSRAVRRDRGRARERRRLAPRRRRSAARVDGPQAPALPSAAFPCDERERCVRRGNTRDRRRRLSGTPSTPSVRSAPVATSSSTIVPGAALLQRSNAIVRPSGDHAARPSKPSGSGEAA
jgi:hypothetical protein